MRRLLMTPITFVLMFFWLTFNSIASEPTFKVMPDQYVWHVWLNPPYHQTYPSWSEFLHEVMELNKIYSPGTFTTLPAGYELKLPSLPSGTDGSSHLAQEVEVMKKKNTDLSKELEVTRVTLTDTQKKLNNAKSLPRTTDFTMLLIVLSILLAVLLAVLAFVIVRFREQSKKITLLEKQSADTERLLQLKEYFLNHYAVPVDVPKDIGRVLDSFDTIYLLKTDPIEGEKSVKFPHFKEGKEVTYTPIKLKNVKRHLDSADENDLKWLGIKPLRVNRVKPSLVTM